MEKCRLCLSTLSDFTSVSEVHDGLPLSVIIMIVCPIRVDTKDSLPKVVCEDCLETVLSAFRLREASIKNDRHLREAFDCGAIVKQEIENNESNFVSIEYKQENTFDDDFFQSATPSPTPDASESLSEFLSRTQVNISKQPGCSQKASNYQHGILGEGTTLKSFEPWQTIHETATNVCGFSVHCHKASSGRSLAWQYFGNLVDSNKMPIESESAYIFCKICVAENSTKQSKFKRNGTSTSNLFSHLKLVHRIGKTVEVKTASENVIHRLKCDLCPGSFAENKEIAFHMIVDHSFAGNFKIKCKDSNKLTVWSYFGLLLYSNEIVVPEASMYNFCKVCLEKDQKLSHLIINSSQKALSDHLRIQHGIIVSGTSSKSIEVKMQHVSSTDEIGINTFGFGVYCFKASINRSLAWQYFGILVDSVQSPVESEREFVFCKICVAENWTKAAKFKLNGTSTSNLFYHLNLKHGIGKDFKGTILQTCINQLKCDLCPKTFAEKHEIAFHMIVDHCSADNFTVECKERNKSMVWSYFGRLLHSDKTKVPEAAVHTFCKVCVEKDRNLSYRFINLSQKSLSDHLHLYHDFLVKGTSSKSIDDDMQSACTKQEIEINAFGFGVHCHKESSGRSLAWQYFGILVDSDKTQVEAESAYIFCKICVAENWNEKRKFKRNGTSTSSLLSHLYTKHGVDESFKVKPSENTSSDELHPEFTESKSDNLLQITFNTAGVGVDCKRPDATGSKVWKYFGALVDKNREQDIELDPHHFYCKICVENEIYTKFEKTTATLSLLKHVKLLHSKEFGPKKESTKKSQKCKVCKETFKKPSELRIHMRRNHPNEPEPAKTFMCHICSKFFAMNHILTKHMKVHEGHVYQCTLCPANFTLALLLKRHMNVHDPSHRTRFKCDHCEKGFSERQTLQRHLKHSHSMIPRERKHQCVHCEAKFLKAESLRVHLMKHTGEKPHACSYCDNTYIQKGDLVRHLKKMHVGDNIYKCTIEGCTEGFGYQVELREHYRVHYESEDVKNVVEVKNDAQ